MRILTGVRLCGKTSPLTHLTPRGWSVANLDDFQLRALVNRDPAMFFQLHPLPAIIDEIQYVPALFPEIKRRVDLSRSGRREGTQAEMPQVWASGSNQVPLDRTVKESLSGRVEALEAKMGVHSIEAREPPRAFEKEFPGLDELAIVSYGGEERRLSDRSVQVPVTGLSSYLSRRLS